MNIEIKFRGFSLPENRFVVGNYVKSGFNHFIVYDATEDDYRYSFDNVFIPCDEKSICQFTGLKDIDGKEIYEDDVCEVNVNIHGKPSGTPFKAGIKYNEKIGAYQIKYKCMAGGFCTDNIGFTYFLKVIGNIHENPELLHA